MCELHACLSPAFHSITLCHGQTTKIHKALTIYLKANVCRFKHLKFIYLSWRPNFFHAGISILVFLKQHKNKVSFLSLAIKTH